ncbi:tRNA (adenosine(37)-N6)-threonylcarbamoyltransferase complex dimerization subunit type 1 TsaB [Tropicimonas sp. IMCC34011]|uniref:tRNA (adenosine(37)-N6)-threonylcarbamoyltransferase complex dimerization subunit type 1 TsaB n=1 Tax=Tropicimonas sp. IMCC34011 TaxID=2248759 RepID=UPI000E280CDF|nr:tRNA (adenosine(37)-N6)-threonylcarbamoyltransferase complex dimerization subunit type 1 TsaB [Tropicimonas sp. IMCC34011]
MSEGPLILSFDTSAAHCAAAVMSGHRVLADRVETMQTGQAERLMPLLGEVLGAAGASPQDVTAIGVGTGPGNFTGIRIAVSAARGLALSLGRPAIGVGVMEALAEGTGGQVRACLDGRRGAAYLQDFDDGAPGEPCLAELNSLPAAPAGTVCIGPFAEEIAGRLGLSVAAPALPLAEAIGRIALRRHAREGQPRPAPLYLRRADAAPSSDPPPAILP